MRHRDMRHRTGCRLIVVSLIGMLTMLMGVASASATAPGTNGRIAFRRYFNDAQTRGAIFTIDPDGTGLRQLTHRGRDLLDTEPEWSPDGRWIAFDRRAPGKPSRLFKMRANGTHLTRLSHHLCVSGSCAEDVISAWSPDGTLIAFTRFDDEGASVYVMRPDGTHLQEVPGIAELGGGTPQWSPDGSHMVFTGTTSTGRKAIYTIRLDGTHARRVTPWKLHPGGVDWSPDGRWILTVSHTEQEGQNNLYLVHPNGTDLHRITRAPAHVHQWGSFSFSPDGAMITVSFNAGDGVPPDIWVLNVDGSSLRDVADSPFFDSAPDWGSRSSR